MTENPNNSAYRGVLTALATPMVDGAVDYASFEKLLQRQLDGGINGLVPVGTTGESPTLSKDEHLEVIRKTVAFTNGRAPIIAGAGSNSTAEAIFYSKEAEKAGADALLHVTPYYNKPTQEGLFQHFSAIAEQTELPIVLYSIPGRCVIELDPETVARLYEAHPNICVIKESGGNPERVKKIRSLLGDEYTILSGDDALTLPFINESAQGVVSVASNYLVKAMVRFTQAALTKDPSTSEHDVRLQDFFAAIFVEPNPVPIKHILSWAGIIKSPEVRLPLTPLSKENSPFLRKAFDAVSDLAE